MAFKFVLLASLLGSVAFAAPQQTARSNLDFNFDLTLNDRATTTPVPILRFVDTQNPDGSYTYGYEGGDGSYKIETRLTTGEVKGKYGYIDSNGELREVEYGATSKRGFEPSTEGLVLPPPTVSDENEIELEPATSNFVQEEEAERPIPNSNREIVVTSSSSEPRTFANFAPRDQTRSSSSNIPSSNDGRRVVIRRRPANANAARKSVRPVPAPSSPRQVAAAPVRAVPAAPVRAVPAVTRVVQVPQQPQQPAAFPSIPAHRFLGHPAQNIDLQRGTYTISYGK